MRHKLKAIEKEYGYKPSFEQLQKDGFDLSRSIKFEQLGKIRRYKQLISNDK